MGCGFGLLLANQNLYISNALLIWSYLGLICQIDSFDRLLVQFETKAGCKPSGTGTNFNDIAMLQYNAYTSVPA
eukprot:4611761-Amphidinium_carterae.1